MPEHAIKNLISKWPQTIWTKLPVRELEVEIDPVKGTTSLKFTGVVFTQSLAATLVLKQDTFDRSKYQDVIRDISVPNAMLEYVEYLGDFKYVAMVLLHNRYVPICFEAEEVTLMWDSPDRDDRDVAAVLEHYDNGWGWADIFANMLPYWPENRYTRPRIPHRSWNWVPESNPDTQHPYPHVDRTMRLVRVSPDPDDEGWVESEVSRSQWEDAVARREVRETIRAGGYGRYRSPSLDEYDGVAWLGRYGIFDLHQCDSNLVASTADDTGTVIFETVKLGTRDPFTPDWYWEALTRVMASDKAACDHYFNLRNCKN